MRAARKRSEKLSNGSTGTRSTAAPAVFLPARELAPRAVELAVAGQHAERPGAARRGGDQADEKSWVFGAKTIASRDAGAELGRDLGLRRGPDLVHHLVPLAVGEPRGVVPRLDLPVEAGVGPQMMAVRGEVQPAGIGPRLRREQPFETQRSVLSDHSSGNTRFSSVERR